MYCPHCRAADTKVVDSRLVLDGTEVRRRRTCHVCQERFTTYEAVELVMPRVIKRDGARVAFDTNKIRDGLLCALEKRPVSMSAVDETVVRIQRLVRATGEKEISSLMIGNIVMTELRSIDSVAYVRFASVYRRFQDVDAFLSEIEGLLTKDQSSMVEALRAKVAQD